MATLAGSAIRFANERLADFRGEENAQAMHAALEKVRSEIGREYDVVIGGQRVRTTEKIRSLNPARPAEVVGIHQKAGHEHIEPAMQAALHAFETWKHTPVAERAGLISRVA